ncbi:MAG: hypothetical protein IJV35_00665 [Neisseriaceae bacterium]|nr:hypothetical protein [Neisseriaceae bacterium]
MENQTYLEKICQEIYAKHQKALDLIFEYRLDMASELNEIFHKWADKKCQQGEIIYDPKFNAKRWTRFTTKTMSEILPNTENPTSVWGTHNHYFYEIVNEVNERECFRIRLSICTKTMPEELRKTNIQINMVSKRTIKQNQLWYYPFTPTPTKIDENEELSEEKIFKQLDKYFEELKNFESQLVEKLNLNEIFYKWADKKCQQGEIIYDPKFNAAYRVRFTTKIMSEILPDAENSTSVWGTHNYYFYEIVNNRKNFCNFCVWIAFASQAMPEELRKICNQIIEVSDKKPPKNWAWYIPFETKYTNIDENEELAEEKIFKQLDEYLEEVKKFESQLVEKLKQDLPQ